MEARLESLQEDNWELEPKSSRNGCTSHKAGTIDGTCDDNNGSRGIDSWDSTPLFLASAFVSPIHLPPFFCVIFSLLLNVVKYWPWRILVVLCFWLNTMAKFVKDGGALNNTATAFVNTVIWRTLEIRHLPSITLLLLSLHSSAISKTRIPTFACFGFAPKFPSFTLWIKFPQYQSSSKHLFWEVSLSTSWIHSFLLPTC